VAERLTASQEGLSSTELVTLIVVIIIIIIIISHSYKSDKHYKGKVIPVLN
jgi:hypothetical protein